MQLVVVAGQVPTYIPSWWKYYPGWAKMPHREKTDQEKTKTKKRGNKQYTPPSFCSKSYLHRQTASQCNVYMVAVLRAATAIRCIDRPWHCSSWTLLCRVLHGAAGIYLEELLNVSANPATYHGIIKRGVAAYYAEKTVMHAEVWPS